MDPMGTNKCFSICNVKAAPKTKETTLRMGRFKRSMFWRGSKWSNEAKTTSLSVATLVIVGGFLGPQPTIDVMLTPLPGCTACKVTTWGIGIPGPLQIKCHPDADWPPPQQKLLVVFQRHHVTNSLAARNITTSKMKFILFREM